MQYEGYDEPVYAWQSTGGEDYEPKMSLVPLLFGTLKATFYAMLLAMPLSLAAAAYVSHFASPGFKQWIKPAVEIMAALPSVVIGFIAALWLAPILQMNLTSLFLLLMTLPATLLAFLILWQVLRRSDWAQRTVHGREFLILIPVLILGFLLAVWLAPLVEHRLLGRQADEGLAGKLRCTCTTISGTASSSPSDWALRSSRSSFRWPKTRSRTSRTA